MNRLLVAIAAALAAGVVNAGVPVPVSEPGTFELLALGAVAALVLRLRNRR